MRVEVDNADGAVRAGDAAEEWESDRVVAAEGDDSRERLALQRWALLIRIRGGGSSQDAIVALFDLLNSVGVVVSSTPSALHLQFQKSC